MAKNWTNLVKRHEANMDHLVTPYDTTFGHDMQGEPLEPGAECQGFTTPRYNNELERNIS